MNYNEIDFFLPTFFGFLLTIKNVASRSSQLKNVCNSFSTGEIDVYKILDALVLDIDDYLIGVTPENIFCLIVIKYISL